MTDLFSTQKIRLDLRAQIAEAEQVQKPTIAEMVEQAALVRWLKDKLNFYESDWHKTYKAQNEVAGLFERQPDEGLLE